MAFSQEYIITAIEEARQLTQQVHDKSFDKGVRGVSQANETVNTLRAVLFKLDVARHALKYGAVSGSESRY